jgi:hypothetical protein
MSRRTRRAATSTAGRAHSSRANSGFGQLARERPLLVVGAGVAVGMALGALLPWSRMEDELLGGEGERLKDSAREMASDGYEKVKSVAQRTYEAATGTLRGENNGGAADSGTIGQAGESTTYGTDSYR